jgi:site-specific recombinase XerD
MQLRAFVLTESRGFSYSKTKMAVTAVRVFVRFLIVHRESPDGLQYAIPRLAKWGQSSLPRYIEPEVVEQVLDVCEANTPLGSRDRAVLLLLARLGLRAGDVANLRLDDLDWTRGRLRVSGKSRQSTWLPLPQDAGDAVLHYLTTARPPVRSDMVFLITCAPYTGIPPGQVSATAKRAIRRSGFCAPSLGAHIFRHSAATAWLRQGLSLQSIGTLLRHCDVDTTAIYAKVDIGLLQKIAFPWPEEHTPC